MCNGQNVCIFPVLYGFPLLADNSIFLIEFHLVWGPKRRNGEKQWRIEATTKSQSAMPDCQPKGSWSLT